MNGNDKGTDKSSEGPLKRPKLDLENARARTSYQNMAEFSSQRLELSAMEQKLFAVLLGAIEKSGSHTVVRVAGGWVRDKLLKMENDDIDVAVDNISGVEFASLVNEYLGEQGEETHKIGVIQANPDQSKHLETARVKIFGGWVDCVNLRTETYNEDSRIPEMRFGTAEEDAYRRDFTFNSLFYNINEEKIEDLTGKGAADLAAGVVRTPLPPEATFLDDPLRVLRAVRFAARFAFALDPALAAAARLPAVRQALADKVSRERIGTEVEGMFSGKLARPALAVGLLHELDLLQLVFTPPSDTEITASEWNMAAEQATLVNKLVELEDMTIIKMKESDANAPEEDPVASYCAAYSEAMSGVDLSRTVPASTAVQRGSRLAFLAAATAPLFQHAYLDKKGRSHPAVAYAIREGLKLKSKDAADLATMSETRARVAAAAGKCAAGAAAVAGGGDLGGEQVVGEKEGEVLGRLELGLLLRDLKELWPTAFLSSAAAAAAHAGDDVTARGAALLRHAGLAARARAWGLDGVWRARPPVDGRALMAPPLGLPKGPAMGLAMAAQVRWQIENPEGTAEECLAFLIEEKNAGRFEMDSR